MIVNKKLDRFKQWAGERMGGEIKTNTTDNFKALEQEMDLRQHGMEKLQESMNIYIKAVSKRTELEKKEKNLPIAYLGGTMISHGEDFEHDSEFGQCLTCRCSFVISCRSDLLTYTSIWKDSGADGSQPRSIYLRRQHQLARLP